MNHDNCPCGAELADECPSCARSNPLGSMRITRPAERPVVYGMCLQCGSVEIALNCVTGVRDLSYMGESPHYPTGYGCEVCS